MKKIVVILFLLFSSISLYSIVPPNPDDCLECDGTPWITGSITYTFNYTTSSGPASCIITVGYGYRVCNGVIECYIDRLFVPTGSCYTKARHTYGFYENAENELTIQLAQMLNIPSNGSSYTFKHWRPASCNALCWNTDYGYDEPIMTAQIFGCGESTQCCLEEIVATRDAQGILTTDFNSTMNYTECDEDPDIPPLQVCEYLGDCTIECR